MEIKFARVIWNGQWLQNPSPRFRTGGRYYAVLCDGEELRQHHAWSVWFVPLGQDAPSAPVIAFSLLDDTAAAHERSDRLVPGSSFFLMEGPNLLGCGEVVEAQGGAHEIQNL